jgi:hypothetical protein
MAEKDTSHLVAFHELRKFSKSWKESTLSGFGIRSFCYEGPEVEDTTFSHVIKLGITTVSIIFIKSWSLMAHA